MSSHHQHRTGRVIAWTGTPQYARLRAALLRRRAREVMVRHYPDGRKAVLFEVGPKRNDGKGSITVGPEFFQSALNDYVNWRLKWWREAIQNSVDAGATYVECGVIEQSDGTFRVWCQDDGRGMDRATLLEKFLVLGASGKKGDANARGGFGKAKEMLLLPWLSWTVVSRGTRVDGAGIDYEVRDQVPAMVGTRLEVVMPADNATTAEHAAEFIARCWLKGVTFKVWTQNRYTSNALVPIETQASLKPGKVALELEGKARIHYDKRGPRRYLVRTGGLLMFDQWVPDGVEGTLLVELTGRSIELLTANRDGLRDADLRQALAKFTSELSADTKSALSKRGLVRKVYRGTGRFASGSRETEAALTGATENAVAKARPLPQGRGFVLSGESVLDIVETLAGQGGASLGDGSVSLGSASGPLADAMLSATPLAGPDQVEAAVKLLAWQPDFLLLNDRDGWKPPRSLTPEAMSKRALALAKLWAEIVRYVLIRLGSRSEYGIGWTFGDMGAAYSQEQGQHWLLLNPLGPDVTSKPDEVPDPSGDRLLQYLFAAAIHEATHMADGVDLHNERFASAYTRNVAKCADGWAAVLRIREAVLRGADVSLGRAIVDPHASARPAAPAGRRERPLPPRERIVEKTVIVERPVDRWHPAPPPMRWHDTPIRATGTPAQLVLAPRAATPTRSQQTQLGLRFERPSASRR